MNKPILGTIVIVTAAGICSVFLPPEAHAESNEDSFFTSLSNSTMWDEAPAPKAR
jgi:hypothetical protein